MKKLSQWTLSPIKKRESVATALDKAKPNRAGLAHVFKRETPDRDVEAFKTDSAWSVRMKGVKLR